MPPKAPRIPDEKWDQYREEIISFYLAPNSLERTMARMAEKYGFRPSKNQYTRMLEVWGAKKYVSGDTWAIVGSLKRKRSEEGKESNFSFYGRKYTRQKVDKEIARHVTSSMGQGVSESTTLPDYITVSTPPADSTVISRKFLLRNLPWYQYTQEVQTFVSRGLHRSITHSTSGTSLELIVKEISSQSESNMLQLCATSGSVFEVTSELYAYLPPEDATGKLRIQRKKSPFSTVVIFLQRFLYLATNNLLPGWQFNQICDRIVSRCGADFLVSLCRQGSPSMKIFTRKVLCSAVNSGNIALARKCIHQLQNDLLQSQYWVECLSTAFSRGDEAMVELLCKAGAPPRVRHRVLWNRWEPRLSVLHTLFAFGANPDNFIVDEDPGFPLVYAAWDGSFGVVKLLLNAGARVDLYLPQRGTALQAAVSGGHLEVAECLIQFGADVNAPSLQHLRNYHWTADGNSTMAPVQTPVQLATRMNDLAFLQLLLEHGASAIACPFSIHPDFERSHNHYDEDDLDEDDLYVSDLSDRYKPQYYRPHVVHTALQYGILSKNGKVATLLLSLGVDPDCRVAPWMGDTPLQMSARLGNFELAQLLLREGADVNAPPAVYNGRTALQGAAESGNWEILSMLLSAGAKINAPAGAELGLTALQAACLNGHSLMAGFLLAHQANLNAAPSSLMGLTPIQAAVMHGDVGLIRDLIRLGADINAQVTETAGNVLLTAMSHRSLPLLKLLVQHGAKINPTVDCRWQSPLAEAASLGWLEGVKFLLDRGANVNAIPLELTTSDGCEDLEIEWRSPLGSAISNGAGDIVDLLLKHGADVLATASYDSYGPESALVCALPTASPDIIKLLLAKVPELEKHPGWEDALKIVLGTFARLNRDIFDVILEKLSSLPLPVRRKAIQKGWNRLPSYRCAVKENEEVIGLLIDLGADLGGRAEDGSTLLQRLACKNYYQPCCLLISHGATVNTLAVRDCGTPLQEAIKRKNLKLADFLLEQGADVNALPAEIRGVTALQAASMHGMLGLAVRLLESGADVSAPAAPNDGRTAIDAAAENGHKEMVQLLLNAYGDQEDLGPVCHQAAGYAEKEGHFEIAQWLRGYSCA